MPQVGRSAVDERRVDITLSSDRFAALAHSECSCPYQSANQFSRRRFARADRRASKNRIEAELADEIHLMWERSNADDIGTW